MGQQPRGERVGLPISKHVDRAMGGHVDQHGAVDMPAAQREIVHSQHPHPTDLRVGERTDQPQQRASARRQPQRTGQSGARPAGQGQPDRLEHPAKQRAAPRMACGQSGNLLGERPSRPQRLVAEEASHLKSDLDPAAGNRRIGQPPLVPAVDPQRPCAAAPTRRSISPRTRPDPHQSTDLIDPLDHHIRKMRQQNPQPILIITRSEMITRG